MGHRKERDKRITTHCALVARAFGARKIVLSGEKDETVLKSVRDAVERWGGPFEIEYREDWKKTISNFKGLKAHLTMYGTKADAKALKKTKNLLVVIGAEKVPAEVYKLCDFNIAIGSQPHSEVAALAVFLLKILGEKKLWEKRKNAKMKIIPQKNSKKVVTKL
ncbi:MAG: tRNA (cytidine(56)-2'-O)-methyltransferase [Candidatus Norongarragalinales archaeon]